MAPRRSERGQALVESAIVLPIVIFLILGALQLVMMQHGKIMTEYAAYNAARAGIVHNANWNVMRNAALISVLPLYIRTDDPEHLLDWWRVKAAAELTELVDTAVGTVEAVAGDLVGFDLSGTFPDISLIEVEVKSPVERDFRRGFDIQIERENEAREIDSQAPLRYPEDELDFDDRDMINAEPRTGRLSLEVRVLYPLRVPLVNWIFFQLWYAQSELRLSVLRSSLGDWATYQARVASGQHAGKTLEQVVEETDGQEWWDDFATTQQRTREARFLRDVATDYKRYFIPLRASYAMQMQSNPFYENRRQSFSLGD